MSKIKKKSGYCPICDKEYIFYSKDTCVDCITCGHHLVLHEVNEETSFENIHNAISKDTLKEFDNLLTKYSLSSTTHLEKHVVDGVKYYNKHIQINLVVPDFYDDKKGIIGEKDKDYEN